ncbi:TRAP transporter small permease [Chelatococcus sp. GCM10030263]|uniref:TRAP transporter small permease n=1 Tax=Chelatococcus sp. GCM10030263 TaxID=3273387 RepID=UPI00361176BA
MTTEQPKPGILEKLCELACALCILASIASIVIEIVARNLFDLSFQLSDELGGYLLVAITFLSLSVCQVHGAYHHVEFVQARLPPRARHTSRVIFDAISLAFCLILIWQFYRLTSRSWSSGDFAPTIMQTPMWLPQLSMLLGVAALLVPLGRSLVWNFAAALKPNA